MHPVQKGVLLTFLILESVLGYSFQISLNKSSQASVTNFQTDLGECSCDLTNTCDNFCCCDSACDAALVAIWQESKWCRISAVEIEKECSEISTAVGYSSFEDLGCIMYSNRASIGNYHNLPSSNSFVYNVVNKFAYYHINAPLITHGATTPTAYQQNSIIQLQLDGVQSHFQIWRPSAGEACAKSYVTLLDQSQEYECIYPIDSDSCSELNEGLVASTLAICDIADCSTVITNGATVSAASYSGGTCTDAVTEIDFTYTLGYENGQYKLTSGSIVFTTDTITTGRTSVLTKITVTIDGSEKSGNPGYLVGDSVLQYGVGSIGVIADDANSRSCLAAAGTNLPINFGVNQTWSCETGTNPCASSIYVDQLPTADISLRKYATGSQTISIVGLDSNTCSKQSVTLNIVYSKVGWVMDPQYYIIGALYTASSGANTHWTTKSFSVKWFYADPSSILAPPTNNFYSYFSLLWSPLQTKYQEYLEQSLVLISVLFLLALFVL